MTHVSLEINEQTISTYKEILTNPGKYGINIIPIQEFFEKSEKVIAKHTLAEAYYKEECNNNVHKLICYIIMDEVFGVCKDKDENGNLGYYLKIKEPVIYPEPTAAEYFTP